MENVFTELVQLKNKVLPDLQDPSDLDVTCKSLFLQFLDNIDSFDSSSMLKIQAVLDYMHEQINSGKWKDVKLYLRKTVTIASYLKLLIHFKLSTMLFDDILKESFKIIDHGILFGCPLKEEPKLLQKCASIINCMIPCNAITENHNNVMSEMEIIKNNSTYSQVTVLNCPSMETFLRDHILQDLPAVLENCINHWPAIEKWKDQNYFIKLAGMRTVAVEIGREYTNIDWTQKLMTMQEFIKNHIFNTNGPVGYLAQYQLFDHIPELKQDIKEPEYCCFSNTNEPVDINAWYGPQGTLSPLHYDVKKNLLAQVVGHKQIFLYPPSDTEYLYPYESELLHNTAQVDPRNPDFEKYPKYKEAKPYYCTLSPGQILYIPPKWWHCVESLSVSFSVSFWWE